MVVGAAVVVGSVGAVASVAVSLVLVVLATTVVVGCAVVPLVDKSGVIDVLLVVLFSSVSVETTSLMLGVFPLFPVQRATHHSGPKYQIALRQPPGRLSTVSSFCVS